MPSERLIHSSNGEKKEGDKSTKGTKGEEKGEDTNPR
jgi:hypothetical protein